MPTLLTPGKDVITNVNPVNWSVKKIVSFSLATCRGIPKSFLYGNYLKDKKNLVLFRKWTTKSFLSRKTWLSKSPVFSTYYHLLFTP